ncbi:MAG: prepilin-type N-terminal cleavage/methylation domain-containing protein [Acidobacteria bacterium]|nr:prepilin-type N-terminal cleavage/methylation domain-containing protein [Acidobacteriota bacterium]
MDLAKSESADRAAGFSLVEVLFATAILATALVGLAQMFAVAIQANTSARSTTFATILAEQKMEQLRELRWSFDSDGGTVTDLQTNLAYTPPNANGSGLMPSPSNALQQNTAGCVDYLDATGKWVGTGAQPVAGTVFIRRWSITPLPVDPADTLILQVFVTHARKAGAIGSAGGARLSDQARLMSLKTRKSP